MIWPLEAVNFLSSNEVSLIVLTCEQTYIETQSSVFSVHSFLRPCRFECVRSLACMCSVYVIEFNEYQCTGRTHLMKTNNFFPYRKLCISVKLTVNLLPNSHMIKGLINFLLRSTFRVCFFSVFISVRWFTMRSIRGSERKSNKGKKFFNHHTAVEFRPSIRIFYGYTTILCSIILLDVFCF